MANEAPESETGIVSRTLASELVAERDAAVAAAAERTAGTELRGFAADPVNGAKISTVSHFGTPPLLALTTGPLAGVGEVAWKWCHLTGLSYSVRQVGTFGEMKLSRQHPTIAAAIAEAEAIATPKEPTP